MAAAGLGFISTVKANDAESPPAVITLPARSEVAAVDTWNLSSLFQNDDEWREALEATKKRYDEFAAFRGQLNSADAILRCFELEDELGQAAERIVVYAYLRASEDVADAKVQEMTGLVGTFRSETRQATSFIGPELLALDDTRLAEIAADPQLKRYALKLRRILRQKPHTLSEAEEKLLASMSEVFQAPSDAFGLLNNADLSFGTIKNESGQTVEISTGSFVVLMNSPDRKVRKEAFEKFYDGYQSHHNTLGSLLGSSIKNDVRYAKTKRHASALDEALFNEEVSHSVYDHLIAAVNESLPQLHRYYELRRRKMGIDAIHMYDTYVPILSDIKTYYTWEQAVETIAKALAPLGDEYVTVMTEGLTTKRWCDRYENKGKRSGAFSFGCFSAMPYIMMNYKPDVIDGMFTLAHEAGHSMHSYYSAKKQPFVYYDYVTFVAEVASTFNEDLLARYLLKQTDDPQMKTWLINRQVDSIRQTLFRQTMFAEFEQRTHAAVEAGEALTTKSLQSTYHDLLKAYFGPKFALDQVLDVECLRVPHFYRGFYVYKYATGISAALALAEKVCAGGEKEKNDYLTFLSGGASDTPVALLRMAGVDMEAPDVVRSAMKRFGDLIVELDRLL